MRRRCRAGDRGQCRAPRLAQCPPPAASSCSPSTRSADWIVDKLLAEGKAPALAALAAEGAVAEGVIVAMPSLTAVAHASLWTGAHPRARA
jgi:hypothetical protein